MDKISAIKSFVEVAKTCSFTQAADNLGLSRLQVSRHVKEVESWLNQRLLHRTTRKVSVTESGLEALKHCERILNETAALESHAQELTTQLSGSIRIATPIGLAQNLLIEAVEEFTELHPGVTIELLVSDKFVQLVDERIDIALRHTVQPAENLIARPLMRIDSVICATETYLKNHGIPQHPEDLENHNCLVHLGIHQWQFIKDNQQFIVEVKGNIKANDLITLTKAASNHKGVINLPCDLANPLILSGQLQPVLTDYHFPESLLWAVYISRSYQLPTVRRFIDFLADRWEDIKLNH